MKLSLEFEVGYDHDARSGYVEDQAAREHPLWGTNIDGWEFGADNLQDAVYQACVKAALEGLLPCLIKPITRYRFHLHKEAGEALIQLSTRQARAVWKQLVKDGWVRE